MVVNVFVFGEESKILEEVKRVGAKQMNPEQKLDPKIYYKGLPSPSLAGHIIDKQSLMDVSDAAVTVNNVKTGAVISCKSNVAGIFLVDGLDMNAAYTIKIESTKHQPKAIDNVILDIEYKHLGDVKLNKTS